MSLRTELHQTVQREPGTVFRSLIVAMGYCVLK